MLRVRSLFTGVAGSPFYSNLFFAGTLSTEAQDAVDGVRAMWARYEIIFRTPMQISVEEFVPSIDPATGNVTGGFVTDPDEPLQCTNTGEALPPATQAVANLLTNTYIGGRRLRGKCFLPGWTVGSNTATGLMESDARQYVQDGFNDLIASGPDLLVWSRKNGQTAPVAAVTVPSQWGILRSRRD